MMMRSIVGVAAGISLGCGVSMAETTTLETPSVGYIELDQTPVERPGPFDWLSSSGGAPTLLDVVGAFDRAAERDDLEAVVVRLKGAGLGLTQVEEIGQAMERVRASGKQIHVFAEGYGTSDLLLGSYADEVLAQSGGPVSLPGLYAESMFYREMFDWVGITPDFVQVGDYKGANEAYMNSEPSEPWEENITQLLDSIYANLRSTLKIGRGMTDRSLDRAMNKAWYTDAATAARVGLIDATIDLDDLGDHVDELYGDGTEWDDSLLQSSSGLDIDPGNPFAAFTLFMSQPDFGTKGPTIAVVHIDGPIIDGDSQQGGLFGSSAVGSRTIRGIINDLSEDDNVKGVVVRINSPGGSATASEVIWQGFRRLAEDKPVWVSVGNMAASGGYYIAVSGDKIYANPSSIVGSIGVVGGKLAMGGVYDNLHLNVVTRSRGPKAGMFGSVNTWSMAERRSVRKMMTQVYDQFTDRVTAGRPGINLAKTAEGRLFTGDRAISLDMVDELGALSDAIEDMADHADLGDYDVLHYPGPQDLESLFEQAFGMASSPEARRNAVAAGLLDAAGGLMSPQLRERVQQNIDAAIMMRDQPVMLMELSPVVFR